MEEDRKLEIVVIRYTWLAGIAISIILLIINLIVDKTKMFVLPISYFLGLMVGLMCFNLRIKSLDKGLKDENRARLKRILVRRTFINLFLYLVILGISGYSQFYRGDRNIHLNIFAVAGGILTLKAVIYFKVIVIDHKKFRDSPSVLLDDSKEEGVKDD